MFLTFSSLLCVAMQSDTDSVDGHSAVKDDPRDASVKNVKPSVKTIRPLTDEEYDAIFDAVFARYPPLDSQDSGERIVRKEDDADHGEINQINDNAVVDEFMEPDNEISSAELVQIANETTPCASDTEYTNNDIVSRSPPKVGQKKKGLYSKRRKLSPSAFTFSKIPIEKLDGVEDNVLTSAKKQKCLATKVEKRKQKKPEFSKAQKFSRKSMKQTDHTVTSTEDQHTTNVDTNTCANVNLSKKQKMLERSIAETGTWVQCGKMSCLKWRLLPDVHDPSLLPTLWTCNMNQDSARNSCSKPEEDYDEAKHVFTRFTEGSVVWARMAGYPWWPAMVEIDPDYDIFYECKGFENVATHYHVVFFDDKVSRAWLGVNSLNSFETEDTFERQKTISQGVDYKRRIKDALVQANEALQMSIPERLKTFTFGKRFSGRWGKENGNHGIGNKPGRSSMGHMSKKLTRQPKPTEETEVESEDDLDELLDDVLMKSAEDVLEDLQFLSSPDGMDLIESGDSEYDPEADSMKLKPKIDGTEKAEKRKKHKKPKNRSSEDVKKKPFKKHSSTDEIPTRDAKKKRSKKERCEKRSKKEKSDKPKQMKKASSENLLSKKHVVAKTEFAAPERNIPEKRETEKLEENSGSKSEQKAMKRPVFKPQKPTEKPKWEPVKKEKLKLDSDVFTMELDSQKPSEELLSCSVDKLKSKDEIVDKNSAIGCEKLEKKPKVSAFKAPNKTPKLEKNSKVNMPFKPPVPAPVPATAIDKTPIEKITDNNVELFVNEQDNELVIDMDGDIETQDNINNVDDGNIDSDDSEPFELEEPVIAILNKLGESQDSPLFELEQ